MIVFVLGEERGAEEGINVVEVEDGIGRSWCVEVGNEEDGLDYW